MGTELQHWLSRNRPPRVQITYDVETLGATVKQEIPFIAGIIGDFAGGDRTESKIADRSFVEIDRDNFVQVMQGIAPGLSLAPKQPYTVIRTPGTTAVQQVTDTTEAFAVALAFKGMPDFEPPSIIGQVPSLQALMDTRQSLADLVAKLGTDPSQEATLWAAAAQPARTGAATALTAANNALGTAAAGTLKLFNDAATAVLAVETADPNKTSVTNAQAAVTTAVGSASSGYTKAYTTATTAGATSAQVKAAGDAGWIVATALRDGMALMAGITSGYVPGAGADDPKKKAQDAVTAAAPGVASYLALAGQAAVSAASAAVLNPSS
ncbi:MAG TPA: type VI secretion system contractile sheath small subunit [Longimicrobium sp.]|nr:type VI secretion system contractile sheath small subunit [Longimicrobium sp.]